MLAVKLLTAKTLETKMPIKLNVHTASVGVTTTSTDGGEIPANLARLTETVIGLHKANGDLMWVGDMVVEAEKSPYGVLPWTLDDTYGPMPPVNAAVPLDDDGNPKETPRITA